MNQEHLLTQQSLLSLLKKQIKSFSLKKAFPFIGPAYLVSVGYIDPGNWATNIEGGASFGYKLLWVLLLSNLMAILLQVLSAKLGIATGKSLAENCREHFSKPLSFFLWVTAQLAAMATDLAEFLGAALGFYILFGLPMMQSALLAAVFTFLVLALHRYGFRKIEFIIFGLVGIVAGVYVLELFLAKPDWGQVAYHVFVPQIDSASIFVAIGMLGATVMPHNIFLHSAIVKHRLKPHDPAHNQRLFRYSVLDSVVALNTAWFINSAMIIMSAAVFFANGVGVTSIEEAQATLVPLLGGFAGTAFAIALLSSGLSSSVTGTMAGQYIMEGFLHRKIPMWLGRFITMIPALVIIGMGVNTLKALILSQVILSLQLPFTIIPLIWFTRNKKLMGEYVNKKITTILVILVAAIILFLNGLLIYEVFGGEF
ncbi:Nramp family divalent metal transporter [Microaerobacter geothermalis]|uniref:Nramp family divalent metal transporter n=1 Tax=Microaerobacter geothermalis TaxID=674972 RepID=UPI001F2525E9|nr:Nramp family divalent metal transporter [Microaerobacter geothermalis]MCF6093706.1 Nramp family divalent metal transporter [Microaerobacter geothermalis]